MAASPAIQYLQTSDGVRIAYYGLGDGPPVVVLHPNPTSHLTLEWEVPAFRGLYEKLIQTARMVRLDYRGSGLSERGIRVLRRDDLLTDVRAVVDKLALERFSFLTWGFGCALALQIAREQPRRVQRLVLAEANATMVAQSLNQTVADLRNVDTEVQIRTRANLMTGWEDSDNASAMMALIRAGMDPPTFRLWRELIGTAELPARLSEVTQPVLFVHGQDDPLFPLAGAQSLAADLPNAAMQVIHGSAAMSPFTNEDAVGAMIAFLQGHQSTSVSTPPVEHGLLSSREIEVLRLIAAGRTNDEIARELVITHSTVSHHVSNILAKTGLGNRTEAAAFAHRERLL